MQSNISINSTSIFKETLLANDLPEFCKLPIHYATRQLLHLGNGQILIQSFNNYMAHFDLFESSLNAPETINFKVNQSGIFLFMVFKGHAIFSDHEQQTIMETSCSRCYLSYIPAGNYHRVLAKGEHKTLLISVLPDWFINRTGNIPEFKTLSDRYLLGEAMFLNMPHCPLTQSIMRPFKRMQFQDYEDETGLGHAAHLFLNKLINYYHKQLSSKSFTASTLRRKKAEELERFIQQNFASKVADDVSKMADLFCVSEKSLLRLAKAVFGIPLHEQVIRLRMTHGIELILTTSKSIREVAELMGYQDSFYFSKAFKKYHKVSPSELR